MNDMQLDLEVQRVQESRIVYSPEYFGIVIKTRYGWKSKKTGEITWEKREKTELIGDAE